jgi:hypothetical protein
MHNNMKAKVKIHTSEQDIIIEGLRKFGRNAYNATLANDVPVTVLQGKNICRIEPNGDVTVLVKMDKPAVKVSRKTFKLK